MTPRCNATSDQLKGKPQVLLARVIYRIILACTEAINCNGTMLESFLTMTGIMYSKMKKGLHVIDPAVNVITSPWYQILHSSFGN